LLPFKLTELAGYRVGAVIPGRAVILSDAAPDAPLSSTVAGTRHRRSRRAGSEQRA
jgi:hypothetical protein